MIYSLYTLIDITETGQYRSRSDLERLQQQNFDTVIQTIGLAGNIIYNKSPKVISGDIFGNAELRCWHFEWTMERAQLFEHNGDELFRLKELFEFVPVITGLTESVQFNKSMFRIGRNIIFNFML